MPDFSHKFQEKYSHETQTFKNQRQYTFCVQNKSQLQIDNGYRPADRTYHTDDYIHQNGNFPSGPLS